MLVYFPSQFMFGKGSLEYIDIIVPKILTGLILLIRINNLQNIPIITIILIPLLNFALIQFLTNTQLINPLIKKLQTILIKDISNGFVSFLLCDIDSFGLGYFTWVLLLLLEDCTLDLWLAVDLLQALQF
jgi:hypothetical protein